MDFCKPLRSTLILLKISAFLFLSGLTGYVAHADVEVWLDSANGFAIGGYDPVSYFTRRKAVLGDEDFQYDHNDIYWKFESSGNLAVFKRHPDIYRPQFSGYDPFALAKGRTIRGLPTLWVIHRNKLYFFHNIINRRLWDDSKDEYINMATDAWPRLSKTLLRRIDLDDY